MVRAVPPAVRVAAIVFVVLVGLLLLAPLIVVAGVSVSESEFIVFPPRGLSLRWYAAVLSPASPYLAAAFASLKIALGVMVAAILIGGAAAIALHRRQIPFADALSMLFLSPLVLPTIIYAIGMLMFWSQIAGPVSMTTLWIAHTAIALPYVVRTTLAVLAESDPALEEAARTMGADRWRRLWLVVVPQAMPGLAAGAFFAFNISFDEAVLSLFLRTPVLTTLPVQIYGQLEFSPDPSVAAVSTLMIAATVLTMALIDRFLGLGKVVH